MTEENVNQDEETKDEAGEVADEAPETEAETTDAPEGVADVENVSDEAAPEVDETPVADAQETVAAPEPPEAEPATDEPESVPDAVGDGPASASADAEALMVDEAVPAPIGASSSVKPKKKRLPRPLRRQRTKPKREHAAERKPITREPKPDHARGRRQERQGIVVSAASDKTIVVRVDTVKVHPMYKKVIRRSTKLHAHDEGNQAKAGDIVRIVETRPLSKQKRWRLQEIVEAAK
jgi:small subunit ribosomal protein S17